MLKNKSMKLEDNEDLPDDDRQVEKIEIHSKKKKKTKKESTSEIVPFQNPDDDVFIEYIQKDLKNFDDLNKYRNMKSLSLIQQGITSIEVISKSAFAEQIEFLCLNENGLTNLKFVEKLKNLKNLQVNFNMIEKIEYIEDLKHLETLWICENKLSRIENLPRSIKIVWVASNQIEAIEDNFPFYSEIEELNISANNIKQFSDIFYLGQLLNLKSLFINDINFGENPICLMNNYRTFTIHHLPNLELLDNITVTKEELNEIESTYTKKNLFYKNKIKQMNKSTKSIFSMLKCYRIFYTMMKHMQIIFFSKRIKMLEHIQFETNFNGEDSTNNVEMMKELENSKEKTRKCFKGINCINSYFKQLKEFISHINDMMIVK